ncbi:hypothetical protein BJV82DRAFT_580035 [Fennellomyces sp. T-0311]|nr:hypothetical protein BJV82DRAFT_580035 [Fennellomyces sp. T-0311]
MLDPNEKAAYVGFFRSADTEGKGILLKDEAMAFFRKSNVPGNYLNEIWDSADNDKKGFLTDQEFCHALKLIACAQHGTIPATPVLRTTVPLPQLDGVSVRATPPPPPSTRPTPASPSLQSPPTNDTILPEERTKYISLFQSSGGGEGVLQADKARDIFLRSNLPPSTLHQVWALADTRKSGTLNQTEFIIAMHYLTRVMSGNPLPPSLPASIYAAAASGRMLSPVMANRSPNLRRQTTTIFTGGQSHHPGRSEMDISPEEFIKYQAFFDKLDSDKTGHISGGDAVVFFRHSKLPENDLARIWDLADTQQSGQLDVQQFAVAMHLINRRIAGGQIPSALPDQVFSQQPAFANAQPAAAPPQSAVDLLGLGSDDQQQRQLAQQPQPQQPVPTGNNFGQQRSELEGNLAAIRAETQTQMDRNNQLRQQLDSESQAIRELQQTIEREKATLEQLKQAALQTERELAEAKEKRTTLTQDLQVLKQEGKHFKQRAENAQQEIKEMQKPHTVSSPALSEPASLPASDFFTLSNAPQSNELFASVPDTTSSSPPPPARKTFDPFAGFKEQQSKSASSSPVMSLNALKEDAVAKKQARSGTPNVDISEVEAKFPDLSTMEHSFQSPASTGNSRANMQSPTVNAAQVQSPAHTGSVSPPFSSPKAPPLSPSQKKSVAKYGFDLSAFEDNSSSTPATANSGSVKDDLSSLFGSPMPNEPSTKPDEPAKSNNFDDIFGVSQQAEKKPERKPTFDEMFFS